MGLIRVLLKITTVIVFSVAAVVVSGAGSRAHAEGLFFLERPKLGITASYELEEENRTLPYSETKNTTHDMIEALDIESAGWIFHENLIEFRFSIQPEWRQEDFEKWLAQTGGTQTGNRDYSIFAYDTAATLLKQKPISLDVFANSSSCQLDLSYTQDSEIESDTLGTRLNFKNPILPVSIGFVNRQSVQTGFYMSDEERDEVQVKIKHNAKNSTTELNILRDSTDRTTRTTFGATDIDLKTTNSDLTNTYFFTEDNRVRLDSRLYNIQTEFDDLDYSAWTAAENLFWTHSQSLQTQSTFNFNRHEVNGTASDEKAFRALLMHRLGEVLSTNVGAGIAASEHPGGKENRYGTDLDVVYRRPLPWGSVELGAAFDYGVTRRNGEETLIPTEERHVLNTGDAALLNAKNIDAGSIVVTDAGGTIVYTENIDYTVYEAGADVSIRRTLMGAIADGQQVAVRYNYIVGEGYDDARFGQGYRFDMALWSTTYLTLTHRRMDQSILSGEPPAQMSDFSFNSAMLRYDAGWAETRVEYEKQNRRSGNSTVTRSVKELVNFRALRSVSVNLSGRYGEREYTDTDESETFSTLGTDIVWTPEWWCSFSLICLWNDISGDVQDMAYSEISPKIELTYGVWRASLSYRLTEQKDGYLDNSLERERVYFLVNRELW